METDPIERVLSSLAQVILPLRLTVTGPESALIRAFREDGATRPSAAQRVHTHNAFDQGALARLVSLGVVRRASAGRYYLDEKALRRSFIFLP